MKNIYLLSIFLLVLVSCGGFKEAGKVLRNEKKIQLMNSQKREPLVLPNYDKTPDQILKK